MKKIITHLIVGTAVMFMTACGGGGSSDPVDTTDPMTSKDAIAIIYHYPSEACTSDTLLNELELNLPEAENFLIRVESNDVTCATYGKTEAVSDTEGCMTFDMITEDPMFSEYDTSCVLGFDLIVGTTAQVSKSTADTTSTVQWTEDVVLATEFTLDAQ